MAFYNAITMSYAASRASLVLFTVAAVVCAYAPKGVVAGEPAALGGNVYCGPQCVQRVLRNFDIDVDLPDLVREIQWPDVYRGASMDALRSSFESRGVFTKGIVIPGSVDIDWPHPVVVHLRHRDEQHFVVWLPQGIDSTNPVVWDSSLGLLEGADSLSAFNALRTGPALLTSDEPIAAAATQIGHNNWIYLGGDLSIVTAIGLALAYVLCRSMRSTNAQ